MVQYTLRQNNGVGSVQTLRRQSVFPLVFVGILSDRTYKNSLYECFLPEEKKTFHLQCIPLEPSH